jgi:hypothetical protein
MASLVGAREGSEPTSDGTVEETENGTSMEPLKVHPTECPMEQQKRSPDGLDGDTDWASDGEVGWTDGEDGKLMGYRWGALRVPDGNCKVAVG